jgi:CDP-paratose 2-epimerase
MKWFITGGAGFIGANTAKRLLDRGDSVVVFDNLSRRGSSENLQWLASDRLRFVAGDVRDYATLSGAVRDEDPDVVLHLAGQVAVTTSVEQPRKDFEINALGAFNVCESIRTLARDAILLNASTNKVYGELPGVDVVERSTRYEYANLQFGVPELQPLDFHSPYGCSKGAADQYVHDYARIYGIRSVNFRQSCIYGRRQFGIEDQGWVAWFVIAAISESPITIYGDGKQVRDVLFVDDLVDCYIAAVEHIDRAAGISFNIGGGPSRTLSLLELVDMIERRLGRKLDLKFSGWRPGDQRVFISDIRKASELIGWSPKTGVEAGVDALFEWTEANRHLFASLAV